MDRAFLRETDEGAVTASQIASSPLIRRFTPPSPSMGEGKTLVNHYSNRSGVNHPVPTHNFFRLPNQGALQKNDTVKNNGKR